MQRPRPFDGVGSRFQSEPRIGQLGLPDGDATGDIVAPGTGMDNLFDRSAHPNVPVRLRQAKLTSLM
ncbi:hypothetical protein GCM10010377_17820 [Streptomyces viridiviolaceus]|nr:hypothetical protein GCM10010377_17820 [Streptomyces viridiviolaceus]